MGELHRDDAAAQSAVSGIAVALAIGEPALD
jgi:hypothetical protein